jgi:hypothetical protein
MRNQDLSSQQQGGDHPQQQQTLTVAEAAQVCDVSTSTIRRYLRAGRFPGARQQPSRASGHPAQWRIPTEDLLGSDLAQQRPTSSGHAEKRQSAGEPAGALAEGTASRRLSMPWSWSAPAGRLPRS